MKLLFLMVKLPKLVIFVRLHLSITVLSYVLIHLLNFLLLMKVSSELVLTFSELAFKVFVFLLADSSLLIGFAWSSLPISSWTVISLPHISVGESLATENDVPIRKIAKTIIINENILVNFIIYSSIIVKINVYISLFFYLKSTYITK